MPEAASGTPLSRALRNTAQRLGSWASRLEKRALRLPPAEQALLAENAALRGRHANQPAFIIGNGSSLQQQDLAPLADQITFVANGFWRHPVLTPAPDGTPAAWQPRYYSIIDPIYYDGSPPMHDFMVQLTRRVPQAEFFAPLVGLPQIRRDGLLRPDRLHWCVFDGLLGNLRRVNLDLTRPLPRVSTVALLGILAALYMGCRPIYLLGMDHDWLAKPSCRCDHFYAGVTVENHEKVRAIERDGADSYRYVMECMLGTFRGHETVQRTAEELGVEIFNATAGGFLDVYPRQRYEDVLASLNKAPTTPEVCTTST